MSGAAAAKRVPGGVLGLAPGSTARPASEPNSAPEPSSVAEPTTDDAPDLVTGVVSRFPGTPEAPEVGSRAPVQPEPPVPGFDEAISAPIRSRLRMPDLIDEVLAGLFSRPTRTFLTTIGTVIGLASLIVTIGLSRTAGSQIVESFSELQASQVIVTARTSGRRAAARLPWGVEDRLDRLNGVTASGASADVPNAPQVSTIGIDDPTGTYTRTVPVVAASEGMLDAVRGRIAQGRWFDAAHVERADRVAVIGSDLAAEMKLARLESLPGIYIGNEYFLVIGIIDRAERDAGFLNAVVIPSSTAKKAFDVESPSRVIIDVEIGAGSLIAAQAPVALVPDAPENLSVQAPVVPTAARDRVSGDVNSLFLALALVSLLVGAIGIANVTLVTVMERTREIGLRRAIGARRRHIAAQVVGESALIGLVGGILGATIGVLTIVGVSAYRGWTPVLDTWLPATAPFAGAIIGLLAGLYPAIRAARMEPVAALRGQD